ncbi:MAG: hypothetical protein GY845_08395 [Planctomycetes bacterium]|nr:hypothetical protein [Planctomycetota bacterium]
MKKNDMTIKRKVISIVVILLYVITWLGGHRTHSINLQKHAAQLYVGALVKNKEMSDFALSEGLEKPQPITLRKDGPRSKVKWSIPIFPGILLANSYYEIGPLSAKGGTKIILYYGTSSKVICYITKWMS